MCDLLTVKLLAPNLGRLRQRSNGGHCLYARSGYVEAP